MDSVVWQKTGIAAQERSSALTAIAPNGIDIGRIYRIDGGSLKGRWRWIFLFGHSQFRQGIMSGDQASKRRAVDQLLKVYNRYIETSCRDGGGQSRIPIKTQAN